MVKREFKDGWLIKYDGVDVRPIFSLPVATMARPMWAINLKGCNGSGKSTVPIRIIKDEKTQFCYLVLSKEDAKPVATYCFTWDMVIVGTYLTACGGCDSLGNTQIVKEILKHLWKKDCHILFEGVIVGDIKSTFYDILTAFAKVYARNVSFCFMGTKLDECFRRIQIRNGGKAINEELVASKYRNSQTHLRYYLRQGDVNCTVLKTHGTMVEVLKRFKGLYPELGLPF